MIGTITSRGRALAVLGLLGLVAGWWLSLGFVSGVGALLLVLPILGAVAVRRYRFVLGAAREVFPAQIVQGETARVVVTVENAGRLTSGVLLLEDRVPASLGDRAHLVLDRIPPKAQRTARYDVRGRVRGRAAIGPLAVTVTDPFGMARLTRSFTAQTSLVVTPHITALADPSGGSMHGGGDNRIRAIAAGEQDVLPREHRPGDDMRRIHWRATARHGELMVRREEQSRSSSLVVVLDDRHGAHHGEGPTSTFEWAVRAAASISVHFARLGWAVTATTTTGRVLAEVRSSDAAAVELLLIAYADARLVDAAPAPHLGVPAGTPSAVVAVLGSLTGDAVTNLSAPISSFAGVLLLEPGPVDLLRGRGWAVTPWHRATAIDAAWHDLTGRSIRASA